MSIALESGARIGGAVFICGIGCASIYPPPNIRNDPPRPPFLTAAYSSSSSSSIGKYSGAAGRESEDDDDGAMGEVQSAYKGVLRGMESLEESLPIRRGISNHYAGQSKSFTDLSDAVASCASAKDLTKAENAYSRSRRNLLASKFFWEGQPKHPLRSPGGGITKRPGAPARTALGLAVTMTTTTSSSPRDDDCRHLLPTPHHKPTKPTVDGTTYQLCSFSTRSFSSGCLPVLRSPLSSIVPVDDQYNC